MRLLTVIFLCFYLNSISLAQVTKTDLLQQLSTNDQNKVKKAEAIYNKGQALEDEAVKIKQQGTSDKELAKNEKKSNLKRLEASQYYQKANYDLIALLKDNIDRFWKNNKTTPIQANIKNQEDKANETYRKAKSLRKVAEDLTYPEEKLVKILEAEGDEKETIDIFIKVLYAYLNNPIEYNTVKFAGNNTKETLISSEIKDTVAVGLSKPTQKKDSVTTPVITKEVSKPSRDSISSRVKTTKSATFKQDSAINLPVVTVTAKKDSTSRKVNKSELSDKKPSKETSGLQPLKNNSAIKDTGSIYGMVEINEDQIDKFNKFLQTSYPKDYENYIIDFQSLNYRDVDSLKGAWSKYMDAKRYSETYANNDSITVHDSTLVATVNDPKKSAKTQTVSKNANKKNSGKSTTKANQITGNTTSVRDSSAVAVRYDQNNITDTFSIAKNAKKKNTGSLATKTIQSGNNSSGNTGTNVKSKSANNNNADFEDESPATGFTFRVQIAACKIPLDTESLKNIYGGDMQITELKEDGWYKYAIGGFNTYKKARQLRNGINVQGAFVIAYLNGKRIKILSSMTQNRNAKNKISPKDTIGLVFKVQIAASNKPLDKKYIENIYSGSVVEEIREEGWYKYVIPTGSSFSNAKYLIEKEDIPGAFIISYLKNMKIELMDAIRIYRIFHEN